MVKLVERRMVAISCIALLCFEECLPWMCLYVHLDRRWRHVSISLRGQKCNACLGICIAKMCLS